MITRIKKPAAWMLSGSVVLGAMAQGDDGSPYRDIREDAFAIVMGATGPANLSDIRIHQNTITGDEFADTRPARTITLDASSRFATFTRWHLK